MGEARAPEEAGASVPGQGWRGPGEQAEILELVVPLRRFVLSRVRNAHDADDLVQETITRVLAARGRLEHVTLTAYAFTVARNLIANQHRDADLGRRHAVRLLDDREPAQPEQVVLASEDRRALAAALEELPRPHRDQLVEHVVHERPITELTDDGPGAAALAAQFGRTRAKLRLDYLLALRNVTLPTARCRPVLLALSAGDTRRQGALRAGTHLLHCRTCSELGEPLMQRRRALAGVLPWIPLGTLHGELARLVRANPGPSAAAAGAATLAAVAAIAVSTSSGPGPSPSPRVAASQSAPATTAPTPAQSSAPLVGPGGPVLPVAGDLARLAGQRVRADGVRVLAVPADEGFWVGSGGSARVWVQLRTSGESGERVRPGQHLSFAAVVVRHDGGFARRVGLAAGADADLLTRQGAHLEVRDGAVTVRP